jgi:hypothetical protein
MSQQLKERPASMLRAVFAGLGSLLSVVDKVRAKPAVQAPRPVAAPVPPAMPEAEPEVAAAETGTLAAPEAVASEAAEPAERADQAERPDQAEPAAALPLANYDELTLASLRARLRTLSVPQLTELLDYERNHAVRPDVIAMFERRIAKVQAES